MVLTDTHSHIYSREFTEDISQVIERALSNGVKNVFLQTTEEESIEPMLQIYERNPQMFSLFVGLYPGSVTFNVENQLSRIHPYLKDNRIKGIGEIGLDLYWDKDYLEQQVFAFETQMQWSKENNDIPVSIHCRKAFREIFSCFNHLNYQSYNGVFHCFSGDIRQAEKVIELGFMLGIGGVVTFKNAHMAEVVKNIGLQHIVLETDAPYLAPEPFRGKRNEPSFIRHIAERVAQIKEISIDEVAHITTQNAMKLLNV